MGLFLIILTVVIFVALLLVAGMRPLPALMSRFELRRRGARDELARLEVAQDIDSFFRVIEAVLLVTVVLLLVVTLGWLWGTIIAVIVALEYGAIAHLGFLRRQSRDLYLWKERALVAMVQGAPGFFAFIRTFSPHESEPVHAIDSKEELQHLVQESQGVFSADQKTLIAHAVGFEDQTVSAAMTPAGNIKYVKATEFLGPLVLDELHKQGHDRLPVIKNDLDHVVGILHTNDLLTLDNKRSVTAEKAMIAKVYYIHQDDSLHHALAAFLKTRQQLFIVINDERETVGLLTLTDIMESLIGREIHDEDDSHDDIRAVAARNLPAGHEDV
jgi:CBS domain containing-hemolysin-like protein